MSITPRTKTLLLIAAAFSASVALTVFAVPLYSLMCDALNINRPTLSVGASGEVAQGGPLSATQAARRITVRFTANTAEGVPVKFNPLAYSLQVPLGQPVLTAYAAHNLSPKPMDGVAVHMLNAMGGPDGIDINDYVSLQQCFCFESQHYPATQEINLPLSFTLSPNLPEGIHTITFSYTLFEALPNDPRIKK